MAEITFKGSPIHTNGELPAVGSSAPALTLVGADLKERTLADFAGKKNLLLVFYPLDFTPT